jgi:PPOX class probable F420-dependent enzyme
MTPDQMRDRLGSARVARLATVTPGGAPHLVPICFVLEGDTAFSAVDRKPKRTPQLQRLANAAAEPRVCLLADHYEEDWSGLWWVRADGHAATLPPGPDAERAVDLLAQKYEQYRQARPPGPVLRIQIDRWRGWSASG